MVVSDIGAVRRPVLKSRRAERSGQEQSAMPAGGSWHRNAVQLAISVNTLFWKILVTRVNRKMRQRRLSSHCSGLEHVSRPFVARSARNMLQSRMILD